MSINDWFKQRESRRYTVSAGVTAEGLPDGANADIAVCLLMCAGDAARDGDRNTAAALTLAFHQWHEHGLPEHHPFNQHRRLPFAPEQRA